MSSERKTSRASRSLVRNTAERRPLNRPDDLSDGAELTWRSPASIRKCSAAPISVVRRAKHWRRWRGAVPCAQGWRLAPFALRSQFVPSGRRRRSIASEWLAPGGSGQLCEEVAPNCPISQARANFQSRLTVSAEIFRTSAVSSIMCFGVQHQVEPTPSFCTKSTKYCTIHWWRKKSRYRKSANGCFRWSTISRVKVS